jgi:GH25 family lysozyme M1 (1,4-beta-N-acetylmuramidase)
MTVSKKRKKRRRTPAKHKNRKIRKNSPAYFFLKYRSFFLGAGILLLFFLIYHVFFSVTADYGGLKSTLAIPENSYNSERFVKKNGLIEYNDKNYKSVSGVDVSDHQGTIDWNAVRKAGIEFAMIRVGYRGSTEGRINKDTRFSENIRGAGRAGIKTGVYFFSQAKNKAEAIEEAKFVVRQIRRKNVTYPVAFDMEWGKRINGLTVRDRTEITDAFCSVIQENGFKPMIYGSVSWLYTSIDLRYLTKYQNWMACYASKPDFIYHYRIWQYTEKGHISGISTPADVNICLLKK